MSTDVPPPVDTTDRRKWYAALTTAGQHTLWEARPTHNDVLRRTLFDLTSHADRRTLQRLWRRLGAVE